jgi:integrase
MSSTNGRPRKGGTPAPLRPTRTAGVYARDGRRGRVFVVAWRSPDGRQQRRTFGTYDAAKAWKATTTTAPTPAPSRERFAAHALAWVESYRGRTARGVSETTRRRYRDGLRLHAIPYLGAVKLADLDRRQIKAWLAALEADGRSEATIRKTLIATKALFADAVDDGLVAVHPLAGLRWSPRATTTRSSRQPARALTRAELALLLERVRPDRRLLVEFLAATGLRVSEALGLDWPDLDLGARGRVRVTAQRYRTPERVALKSAYARREIPLTQAMADALRELRPDDPRAAEGPVFADERGRPLRYTTLYHRVWVPAREAAALDWAGLHTLRHTCASLLVAEGRSLPQIATWMGHHSPAFTLAVYAHLVDDGVGEGFQIAPLAGTPLATDVRPDTPADTARAA